MIPRLGRPLVQSKGWRCLLGIPQQVAAVQRPDVGIHTTPNMQYLCDCFAATWHRRGSREEACAATCSQVPEQVANLC